MGKENWMLFALYKKYLMVFIRISGMKDNINSVGVGSFQPNTVIIAKKTLKRRIFVIKEKFIRILSFVFCLQYQ